MTLRTKILLYLLLIHAALLGMAFVAWRDDPPWLLLSEVLLVLSLVLGWRLARAFFVPLEMIRTGTELLQESDFTTRFVETRQSEMDGLIRVYNLMADTLREERFRVQEQSSITRKIVDSMPTAVIVCDFDGRVKSMNPAAAALGELAWVGGTLVELDRAPFDALARLEPGESVVVSAGARRFRCARIEVQDRSFGRTWYLIDELTRELRASEKGAYDTLIRTISHEINNSVGAVASMLESTSVAVEAASATPARLQQVFRVSSERLRNLSRFVNRYADLVRIPPPDFHEVDLNALISDVLLLFSAHAGIDLRTELGDSGRRVRLDRNQIEQALVNVLKNATEALGDGGGTVVLRTRAETDRSITIEIEDSGPGLENPDLLFTPFYTTREGGQGLGLTMTAQILMNHHFGFALENSSSGGARFSIRIPAP